MDDGGTSAGRQTENATGRAYDMVFQTPFPRARSDGSRRVTHGFGAQARGGETNLPWVCFSAIEPARAFGRAARMAGRASSWDLVPAAFEVRFDQRSGRDRRTLYLDDSHYLRGELSDQLLHDYAGGARPGSAHWPGRSSRGQGR